jgi:sigma-B regulation protein RsbU (phosphoserine phosphatase)
VHFVPGGKKHYTPGDLLFLYTDGLLEATNGTGKQFGDEQLRELFAKAVGTPQQFLATVLSELRQFTGRSEGFGDDVSPVCIRLK